MCHNTEDGRYMFLGAERSYDVHVYMYTCNTHEIRPKKHQKDNNTIQDPRWVTFKENACLVWDVVVDRWVADILHVM